MGFGRGGVVQRGGPYAGMHISWSQAYLFLGGTAVSPRFAAEGQGMFQKV
jgi:hypothetical protein